MENQPDHSHFTVKLPPLFKRMEWELFLKNYDKAEELAREIQKNLDLMIDSLPDAKE